MKILALDRYVYALYAGSQLLPCYIGVGKGDRANRHMQEAKREQHRWKSRKWRALRACWLRGIPVVAVKIATNLTIDQAVVIERFLIASYGRRDLGTGCLFNASAGGFGIRDPAPSTRAKLSLNCARLNAIDPSRLANLKPPVKGGHHALAVRARISKSLREQWASDPALRAACGLHFRNPTAEQKQKIDAARFGRQGMLGKKHSLETRQQMSSARRGKKKPLGFGAKIKASWDERRARAHTSP